MYTVRDEKGVMKAKLPNPMAEYLMMNSVGEMVEKNFKSTGKTMVWAIKEDSHGNTATLSVPVKIGWFSEEKMKVYLWAGDYLQKDQD